MVINMSLGGPADELLEVQPAIDEAITAGVIVVASAGNDGEYGMGYPGAYAPVIAVGSAGWVGEWLNPDADVYYRMWWLKYVAAPMHLQSAVIGEPTNADDVYVSDFSSRALPGQQLDVIAPGSWVRGPFPIGAGYSHLPWFSRGIGDLVARNGLTNFYLVGGTSMASPHVASVAALMLEKNPSLVQVQVESILKASALTIPASGSRSIFDPYYDGFVPIAWDADCNGTLCDAVGAGLVQADSAVTATPPSP
jgi:subtilisin family serine protease